MLQALSDIQKANRSESTPENVDTEKRLKDIVSGKRAGTIVTTTANGSVNRRGGFKGRTPLFFVVQYHPFFSLPFFPMFFGTVVEWPVQCLLGLPVFMAA